MKKIAIYGKGGVGKSTVTSNLSAALAQKGKRVMQIGCDPKADSTYALRHGEPLPTVLDTVRRRKDDFTLEDIVTVGFGGVACVEAGGPVPGLGCAGRGVITALEKLETKGAYEIYRPDVVFYDVLGDVVCGGFSMPMRDGYADEVYIVTSGENMSIYAAANIASAIRRFAERGYASLGGVIVNRRNVPDEITKVEEFCRDFDTEIVGVLERSELAALAEAQKMSVLEAFPDSDLADAFRRLAERMAGDALC